MWRFLRTHRREQPAIPVPRIAEALEAQVAFAEARVDHSETAEEIRRQLSGHASLVDDTLAAFGKARHARH